MFSENIVYQKKKNNIKSSTLTLLQTCSFYTQRIKLWFVPETTMRSPKMKFATPPSITVVAKRFGARIEDLERYANLLQLDFIFLV